MHAPPIPKPGRYLTGRRRYRALNRWFRSPLLVLEVEENVIFGSRYDPIDGDNLPGGSYTHWRDAKVDDL